MNTDNPLTEDDLRKIDAALALLESARIGSERAVRAGIDIEQLEERTTREKSRLLAIRNEYFPGR